MLLYYNFKNHFIKKIILGCDNIGRFKQQKLK